MGRSRASRKRAKDVGNDAVEAEAAMAAAVRRVQDILSEHSEQEIRETLLQCNRNHTFAIERLLLQQETRNKEGSSTQLADSSTNSSTIVSNQSGVTIGETRSVPTSSSAAVPSLSVPSSSAITNGENRSVPISSSEAVHPLSVPSSSSVPISYNEAVPSLSVSSSSAITNGQTRSVPISSHQAAPSLPVPSFRALTKVKPKKQDTRMISASGLPMAEVLKRLHVTDAPVKADSPLLHQKPDTTNPISKLSTESDAARDIQHSDFPMATRPRSIATTSLLRPRPQTSIATNTFGTYPSSEPHINQQAMNSQGQVPSRQYGHMILKPDATNYPIPKSSSEPDATRNPQHSAFLANQPTATRQSTASLGPRLHTSMADDYVNSFFSSAEFQQGGGGSNSVHHGNMMNSHHYLWGPAQNNVPSSAALQQHGATNNDTSLYQYLDSAFAQYRNTTLPRSSTSTVPSSHGSAYGFDNATHSWFGCEEDVSINHFPSLNWSGASSIGPSNYHGSDYGYDMTSGNAANSRLWSGGISRNNLPSSNSSGPYSHASAYGLDMTSGNAAANSRLGHEGVSRLPLPPAQHQGRSYVWSVEGEDSYRSLPPHIQQEQEVYLERIRVSLASLDQDYNYTSDLSSDKTQQRPRDKW